MASGNATADDTRGSTEKMLAAIEFSQGIEDSFGDVAAFVPKFLGFLAILVIGYIRSADVDLTADDLRTVPAQERVNAKAEI